MLLNFNSNFNLSRLKIEGFNTRTTMSKQQELATYPIFKVIVLRVIESFVHKSLDETVSLIKITNIINNNPLIQLVRLQSSEPNIKVDQLLGVTIRDVILTITKVFHSSHIHILENNDNFKIRLSGDEFQSLIDKHVKLYQEDIISEIRVIEKLYEAKSQEIAKLKNHELDDMLMKKYKIHQQLNAKDDQNANEKKNRNDERKFDDDVLTDHERADLSTDAAEQTVKEKDDADRAPILKPELKHEGQNKSEKFGDRKGQLQAVVPNAGEEQKQSTNEMEPERKRSSKEYNTEEPVRKRHKTEQSSPIPNKKLQVLSNPLLANIASYKYASTFLQPVSESNAPDYYSLIKHPRDLKTIKHMLKNGKIQNDLELEKNILLMYANAIMYNKTDSDIFLWSKEMKFETDKLIKLFKEAE